MALWTPYADSIALDLSKKIQDYPPVYHFGYYPPQPSPVSSSGYDTAYSPQEPLTPRTLSPRLSTLSPPISPASHKRTYSMIDDSLSDDPDFQSYERDALRVMAERNGGCLLGNNPRMRRAVRSTNETNDDTYRKQRERNNFAAKQSRDRRKLREIHLSLKVSYLRKEVAALKSLLASRTCERCQQSCLC